MLKLGVLASGRGSNLQAILEACSQGRIAAEVALVLADLPGAQALERATRAGVPAAVLDPGRPPNRAALEASALAMLQAHGVELVCLAGFMRVLSPLLLRAFPGRVLNIHPSLLPAFPGLHAVRQALAAGVRLTGCTVHFVDEGIDSGPILTQAAVPVMPDDDEDALAARILAQEHLVYPAAIDLLARGRVRIEGRRVLVEGAIAPAGALVNPLP